MTLELNKNLAKLFLGFKILNVSYLSILFPQSGSILFFKFLEFLAYAFILINIDVFLPIFLFIYT